MSGALAELPSQTELWLVNDVAAYLRVSVNRVYIMERSGDLPRARRVGKSLRWPAAEIRAFVLDRQSVGA
jgi:predicted DNA-binding transcriptional regulator AlpA